MLSFPTIKHHSQAASAQNARCRIECNYRNSKSPKNKNLIRFNGNTTRHTAIFVINRVWSADAIPVSSDLMGLLSSPGRRIRNRMSNTSGIHVCCHVYTVKCRYNAVNFTKTATSSITIANGIHCPDMNPQQVPQVPP